MTTTNQSDKTQGKRKQLKAVLKRGDDLIDVIELPEYGEVTLQMNGGMIPRAKINTTRNIEAKR